MEEASHRAAADVTNSDPAKQTGDAQEQGLEPQMFQIDGEALWFTKFVKFEAIPGAVELLVDYEEMMQQ